MCPKLSQLNDQWKSREGEREDNFICMLCVYFVVKVHSDGNHSERPDGNTKVTFEVDFMLYQLFFVCLCLLFFLFG